MFHIDQYVSVTGSAAVEAAVEAVLAAVLLLDAEPQAAIVSAIQPAIAIAKNFLIFVFLPMNNFVKLFCCFFTLSL